MAVQDLNETTSEAMLTTLQRIELTLESLPTELAASKVVTLSEEAAKEILLKRHQRISHWNAVDNKAAKRVKRYGGIEDNLGLIMAIVAIGGFMLWINFA